MSQELVKNQNLQGLLEQDKIKQRLEEVIAGKSSQFISTLLTICNNDKQLQACEPRTVLAAAVQAVSIGLRIEPTFGQAYIVPYKGQAQFQIGWRGYVQLAQNTGLYVTLHAGEVYEGEVRGRNPLTGELILGERKSNAVIGYSAYFKLVNGFEKSLYMTKEEVEAHAQKYSQSYAGEKKNYSVWIKNFDAMAKKTVIKLLLKNWGPLSVEMRTAFEENVSRETQEETEFVQVE